MKRKVCIFFFLFLLLPILCFSEDYVAVSANGWYGYGSSLGDYYLTGSAEALDLEGHASGGNVRLEMCRLQGWYTLGFWIDYTGSYMLTGGLYDVLRLADLSVGGTARISAFRYAQPYISAGLVYSHYLLFVPYHPTNSPSLPLVGARVNAGVLSEVWVFDFDSWELGLQLGPEYVLETLFSGTTPIFLHEIRGRVGLEMRLR